MSQRLNPVVVGGGQTGIASSYYLKQEGPERVVLERAAHPLNREAVHAETAFDENGRALW